MIKPIYTISNKTLNNIVRFERNKVQIEETLNLRESDRDDIVKEKRIQDIYHLSHLMGINISLREIENITKSKKPFLSDPNAKLIVNFHSSQEFIRNTIKNNFASVEINFFIQLNKLLLNSYSDVKQAKLRDTGEAVDKVHDEWSELRDLGITSAYIRPRLASLIEYYRQTETKVNNLINLPIILYNLIRIAPFVSENKLTNITIFSYLSLLNKFTEFEYISLIKLIDLNEQKYIETWFKTIGNKEDLTLWIDTFIEDCTNEISEVYEKLSKRVSKTDKKSDQPFLNLNPRQLKILRYLQNIPTVKREEYCEMMDISTMTAFRDLDELVSKKLIKINGKGRGTKYLLYSR